MKQINLLQTKAAVQKQKRIITVFRKGVVVVGTVVLLSVMAILYLSQQQQSQKKALEDRKTAALLAKSKLAAMETQARLVESKTHLIQKFIEKEPRYSAYLNALSELLPVSTQEATLVSVTVDRQKVSQVQLAFTSAETMQTFLQRIEQTDVQKRFKKISVKELSVENKALSKGSTLALELQWNE